MNGLSPMYYINIITALLIFFPVRPVFQLPCFSDYKMYFSPQIWEENGGASYISNVAYLAHWGRAVVEQGFFFLFSSSKTQGRLMVWYVLQSEKYGKLKQDEKERAFHLCVCVTSLINWLNLLEFRVLSSYMPVILSYSQPYINQGP